MMTGTLRRCVQQRREPHAIFVDERRSPSWFLSITFNSSKDVFAIDQTELGEVLLKDRADCATVLLPASDLRSCVGGKAAFVYCGLHLPGPRYEAGIELNDLVFPKSSEFDLDPRFYCYAPLLRKSSQRIKGQIASGRTARQLDLVSDTRVGPGLLFSCCNIMQRR